MSLSCGASRGPCVDCAVQLDQVRDHSQSSIAEAVALLDQGAYGEALNLLEAALRESPDEVEARTLLARTHVHLGDLDRAEELCRRVMSEHPTELSSRINLALIRLRRGDAGEAAALLQAVVELEPGHERAWAYLGVALELLGRVDEAERALRMGNHHDAAVRLRDRRHQRHTGVPDSAVPSTVVDEHTGPTRERLVVDGVLPSSTRVGFAPAPPMQRFVATLVPPDILAEPAGATRSSAPPAAPRAKSEIPPEAILRTSSTPARPELAALLDAALGALVVLPEDTTLSVHPTGLFSINLRSSPTRDASCVARTTVFYAASGDIERTPIVHAGAPYVTLYGSGQVILAPQGGRRLVPLQLDADSAYLRGQHLVAYDGSLLFDTAFVRVGAAVRDIPFLHFRGEGFIVLELDRPFVAFDVHRTSFWLRQSSLLGWIGDLKPEHDGQSASSDDDPFLVLRGEGTVLLHAPPAAAAPSRDPHPSTQGSP